MRKKFTSLCMAMMLTMTFVAGCGSNNAGTTPSNSTSPTVAPSSSASNESTAPESTTPDATEPELTKDDITLTVWESLLGPDEFIKQAGAKFTEKYPNIKIEFKNVELGDTTTQIALDGPGGVGPDIFAAPHDKLGELVAGGHVLPAVDGEYVTKNALAACSKALTYEGKVYGYPASAETYALYYNTDLISEDQVPKTWEDLITWSKTFNAENSGKYGFMMDVGNGYYSIIFTTSNDNRLFGADGVDTTNTNINSAESVKGMQFFQSLRTILDVPAADITTDICDGAFKSGTVAMYISGPWNVATFKEAGINFGVTTLPSLPGNTDPAASFSGTRAMFVSAYSNHPAEADAFAKFLMSEEMQKLRFEITGAVPAINTTVESPYIAGFIKQLDYAFPMPSIPQMSAYWDAMNAASANIWNGTDVQKELDTCNSTILGSK